MPTGPKAQPNSGVPRAKSTPTSPRFNHANLTPRTTILSQAAGRVEAQRRAASTVRHTLRGGLAALGGHGCTRHANATTLAPIHKLTINSCSPFALVLVFLLWQTAARHAAEMMQTPLTVAMVGVACILAPILITILAPLILLLTPLLLPVGLGLTFFGLGRAGLIATLGGAAPHGSSRSPTAATIGLAATGRWRTPMSRRSSRHANRAAAARMAPRPLLSC